MQRSMVGSRERDGRSRCWIDASRGFRFRRAAAAIAVVSGAALTLAGGAGCVGSAGGGGGAMGGDGARPPAPRALAEYGDPVVRSVLRERALETLERAARSETALLRANAIEALQLAPSRAEPFVMDGLSDENSGVRFVAAMTAGRLKLRRAASFLDQLRVDGDARVRMAAIYGLDRLGVEVNPSPVGAGLRDASLSVRTQAAFVLGELGDATAAPMLREASARSAPGERRGPRAALEAALMRLQIAEALIKLGEDDVESVLRSALHPGTRDEVEAAVLATQIIGELRIESATSQLVGLIEETVPGSGESVDVRRRSYLWPLELRLAAALALTKMNELGGVFVADLAFDHPDPAVRSQAAFVYGYAARSIDLAKLELLTRDANPLVTVAASAGVLRALERSDGEAGAGAGAGAGVGAE